MKTWTQNYQMVFRFVDEMVQVIYTFESGNGDFENDILIESQFTRIDKGFCLIDRVDNLSKFIFIFRIVC